MSIVRCDGRQDVCRNCERLGFECSFQQLSQPPGQYVLKPPEPRRRTQACSQCHLKKTRCLGELPSCSNCTRKGRKCTYPRTRKQGSGQGQGGSAAATAAVDGSESLGGGSGSARGDSESSTPHAAAMSSSSSGGRNAASVPAIDLLGGGGGPSADGGGGGAGATASPESETALELVEDYFRHLYPLPSFAFLHQPTVVQRCRDGTINEPLKLAICALTALQLHRSALCHDLWVQQAEQVVLQQLGRPSIFHLQALLLTIHYRVESGEFPTAFMLAALAARTAVALRLNYERSELLPVAQ
ncbi:hypothetical protein SLS62_009410 [Diatrype stigma]|uniref:Zn(2)-C6 fungal-type domain-containing protein n=1 Tax=Diatrype stigma TaxID=117547 RepID=A0AAN9UGX7_9PEZI